MKVLLFKFQLKRLMGGKNWKQNQKAINFTDLNEKELIQSGEHMRLVHSTEEMEAMVAQVWVIYIRMYVHMYSMYMYVYI